MTKNNWKWRYELSMRGMIHWPEGTAEAIKEIIVEWPSRNQRVIAWQDDTTGMFYAKGDGQAPQALVIPGRVIDLEQQRMAS